MDIKRSFIYFTALLALGCPASGQKPGNTAAVAEAQIKQVSPVETANRYFSLCMYEKAYQSFKAVFTDPDISQEVKSKNLSRYALSAYYSKAPLVKTEELLEKAYAAAPQDREVLFHLFYASMVKADYEYTRSLADKLIAMDYRKDQISDDMKVFESGKSLFEELKSVPWSSVDAKHIKTAGLPELSEPELMYTRDWSELYITSKPNSLIFPDLSGSFEKVDLPVTTECDHIIVRPDYFICIYPEEGSDKNHFAVKYSRPDLKQTGKGEYSGSGSYIAIHPSRRITFLSFTPYRKTEVVRNEPLIFGNDPRKDKTVHILHEDTMEITVSGAKVEMGDIAVVDHGGYLVNSELRMDDNGTFFKISDDNSLEKETGYLRFYRDINVTRTGCIFNDGFFFDGDYSRKMSNPMLWGIYKWNPMIKEEKKFIAAGPGVGYACISPDTETAAVLSWNFKEFRFYSFTTGKPLFRVKTDFPDDIEIHDVKFHPTQRDTLCLLLKNGESFSFMSIDCSRFRTTR